MDRWKEHSCIMNTSLLGRSVTGLISEPPPASLLPLPQSPAVDDRELLRQLAAFPLSCVYHSCHIHSLSQVVCVHALLRFSLAVSIIHARTHAHPPMGAWSGWKFGQTLIRQLSVSAVTVGRQGCHSCLNDLQALAVKTSHC